LFISFVHGLFYANSFDSPRFHREAKSCAKRELRDWIFQMTAKV
jgi:hypothetical protein